MVQENVLGKMHIFFSVKSCTKTNNELILQRSICSCLDFSTGRYPIIFEILLIRKWFPSEEFFLKAYNCTKWINFTTEPYLVHYWLGSSTLFLVWSTKSFLQKHSLVSGCRLCVILAALTCPMSLVWLVADLTLFRGFWKRHRAVPHRTNQRVHTCKSTTKWKIHNTPNVILKIIWNWNSIWFRQEDLRGSRLSSLRWRSITVLISSFVEKRFHHGSDWLTCGVEHLIHPSVVNWRSAWFSPGFCPINLHARNQMAISENNPVKWR